MRLEKEDLLEDEEREEGQEEILERANGSGFFSSFFNLLKADVGVGILSLPYALHKSGMWTGMVILCLFAVCTDICLRMLILAKREAHKIKVSEMRNLALQDEEETDEIDLKTIPFSYAAIGETAFGKFGWWLATAVLCLAMLGANTAYLVFIKENMSAVVSEHIIPDYAWILFSLFILIPFSWLRSIKWFSPLSVVGVTCVLVAVFSVYVYGILEIDPKGAGSYGIFEIKTIAIFFGLAAFSNEGIMGLSIPIEDAMKKPKFYFFLAGDLTLFIITCFYVTFAVVGLMLYGDDVESSVTLNLPDPIKSITIVAICLQLIFTYPQVLFITIRTLEPKFFGQENINFDEYGQYNLRRFFVVKLKYIWFRTSLVLITAVVALVVPHFGLFLAFIGAFCNSLVIFLLPPLFYLKICWKQLSWLVVVVGGLLMLLGCFVCGVGSTVAAMDLVESF